MNTIKIECQSCDGTGLYCGMAEPKGTAVVCLTCSGTGCVDYRYKPFVKRKSKSGVNEVFRSRGSFILSCGKYGNGISYRQFEGGQMPK